MSLNYTSMDRMNQMLNSTSLLNVEDSWSNPSDKKFEHDANVICSCSVIEIIG